MGAQDCHAWEIGEMNIYNFLQVEKQVVRNLCKYLLTQEVKLYLFIWSKTFTALLKEKWETWWVERVEPVMSSIQGLHETVKYWVLEEDNQFYAFLN